MPKESKKRDKALDAIKDINNVVWDVAEEAAKKSGRTLKLTVSAAKWSHIGLLSSTIHIAKELSDGKDLNTALEGCIPELGKEVVKSVAETLASKGAARILTAVGSRVFGSVVGMLLFPDTMGTAEDESFRQHLALHRQHIANTKKIQNQVMDPMKNANLENRGSSIPNTNLARKQSESKFMPNQQQNHSEMKQRLEQIYASNQNAQTKSTEIMRVIKMLHKDMLERKLERENVCREQRALANFQGISNGFGMLAQIGNQTGSRGLEIFGTAGMAVTQGVMGFAQLTGTMGMAAVSGAAMITPITAIVGGLITISSLFRRGRNKRQAKAMQKMFKQLSSQIYDLHRDMQKGFEIINTNMQKGFEITNKNMYEGFKVIDGNMQKGFESIHEQMHKGVKLLSEQIFKGFDSVITNQENICRLVTEGYQALDFKLDDQNLELFKLDKKLKLILSQIQSVYLMPYIDKRRGVYLRVERFNDKCKAKELEKILQGIREQLRVSSGEFRNLPDQGNRLSGWFHVQSLEKLLNQQAFQSYHLDLKNVVNIDWAELILQCYIKVMPSVTQEASRKNSRVGTFNQQILSEFDRLAQPTAEFIRAISSQKFLTTFFNYYKNQLNEIKKTAEMLLNPIRSHYSKSSMQDYVRNLFVRNTQQENNNFDAVLKSAEDNSKSMVMQITDKSLEIIMSKVLEYNQCVTLFKSHTSILLDMLQMDAEKVQAIKLKFNKLIPIHENYYRSYGVKSVKEDPSISQKPTYYYLHMPTDNQFNTFEVTSEEIKEIQRAGVDYATATSEYLEYIGLFARYSMMPNPALSNTQLIQANTNYQQYSYKPFIRQNSQASTIWRAKLPGSNELVALEEHVVKPDGDCAFTTLGTDRRKLTAILLKIKSNPQSRKFLMEEVREAFTTYMFTNGGEGLKPLNLSEYRTLSRVYDETQRQLDDRFRQIRNSLSREESRFSLGALIPWLQNNNRSEDASKLILLRSNVIDSQKALNNCCESLPVYEYYVGKLRDTGLWLGYKGALLYAQQMNMSLFIWKKSGVNQGVLELIDSHRGEGHVSNAIHMFHTGGFTHFNLLSELETKTLEKDKLHSGRPNKNFFSQKSFTNIGEKVMSSVKKPESFERVVGLMEPVFKVAQEAEGKSIAYVVGSTGDGKSTLINYLNGSNYKKTRVDDDVVLEFIKGSVPEVCIRGLDSAKSETKFPKLVSVGSTNGSVMYCDFPGYSDSRGSDVSVCGAYAPHFINDKVESVKSIVWAINIKQFKVNKAEKIKDILSNLLRISRNNPDVIANGITIVARGNKYLKPAHVIKKFDTVIKSMDDSSEKKLLQSIFNKIKKESSRVIVSNIFDTTGKSRNEINNAISQLTGQKKENFDFSNYCKEQQKFNKHLKKMVAHHEDITSQLKVLKAKSAKVSVDLEAQEGSQANLNCLCSKDEASLSALKKKLTDLQKESEGYQASIDAVNSSNDYDRIGEIRKEIAVRTQPRQVQIQTGTQRVQTGTEVVQTGTRQELVSVLRASAPGGSYWAHMKHGTARRNMAAWKASIERQGYTVTIERYKPGGWKKVRYHATKNIYRIVPTYAQRPTFENRPTYRTDTIQEPVPGTNNGTYQLTYPETFPVSYEIVNGDGWTIQAGTERKDAGYDATAVYTLGEGCNINITVKALKKYTEEGKQIIATNQASKNRVSQDIIAAQREISQLEATIGQNKSTLQNVQAQITGLRSQETQVDKNIENLKEYLRENKSYFDSIQSVKSLLSQSSSTSQVNPGSNQSGLFAPNQSNQPVQSQVNQTVSQAPVIYLVKK